ncbi:hypothetical protein [Streptomyces albus]|uniref:hypothetical protein n=1 Tax=Streptomyces TaxID=1883 RepID=UPI0006E239E8|nr:hypothetical protein [Streptomyces albus]MDI6410612.1 hypothetical protein [Streptomyces albus]
MKGNDRGDEHPRWQMHAQAEGEGRVFQAAGDQHVTVHVQPGSKPVSQRRAVLAPFVRLLQLVLVLTFVVLGLVTASLFHSGGFTVPFWQGLGLLVGDLALMMITERLTTGRWHRWSRTHWRAPRL